MSELATLAKSNGVLQGHSYGGTPNLATTWDSGALQGCACDYPYTGFDCSLQECPFGDDPYTQRQQRNEVQHISCTDTSGGSATFTLTFRDVATAPISVGATGAEVELALEALALHLDTGLDVDVYVDLGTGVDHWSTVCPDFYIEFKYPNGDLPSVVATPSGGLALSVAEERKGSTEWAECSLRGLCDRSTGECTCFPGYGASDGQGNEGTIANCGYVLPFMY